MKPGHNHIAWVLRAVLSRHLHCWVPFQQIQIVFPGQIVSARPLTLITLCSQFSRRSSIITHGVDQVILKEVVADGHQQWQWKSSATLLCLHSDLRTASRIAGISLYSVLLYEFSVYTLCQYGKWIQRPVTRTSWLAVQKWITLSCYMFCRRPICVWIGAQSLVLISLDHLDDQNTEGKHAIVTSKLPVYAPKNQVEHNFDLLIFDTVHSLNFVLVSTIYHRFQVSSDL